MNHSTPGLPVHHQLPESTQIHFHWVGDAIQPSYPLSSPSPALNLSQHQGLFQHHSSKASILRCSAFFVVQLSHPYMTTGKTIALTRQTFVGKVRSVLFNMLSRLVITFLPRSSVQLLNCVRLFVTPWTAAHQASLFITNSRSPPKSMSVESVIPSNHLILGHPLLNLSQHQCLLQWVSSLHQALKYQSFSLSISLSNEYSELIFFRIHWFDLLDVKGILKSFLQHHCLKASILQH